MSHAASGESLPEVFDRVIASVGEVERLVNSSSPVPEAPTAISVEQVSGPLTVTVVDGRVQSLSLDPTVGEQRASDVLADLQDAINEALAEYERAHLAQLEKVNAEFGTMLRQFGGLQADVQAAYRNDVSWLRQ